jgi:hypothetical protein
MVDGNFILAEPVDQSMHTFLPNVERKERGAI